MRPLTFEKPKPMIEVAGKPLLAHIIRSLPSEITELILVIGYKGEMVRAYFGDAYEGRSVTYVWQAKALGTGHALMLCKDLLKPGERFLFMIGDDLHSSKALKNLAGQKLAMLVHEHPNPKEFGVVEVNEKNEIISFEEKPEHPKSNLVSPAVFVLDTRIFDYPMKMHAKGEYFAVDQISQMMKDHKFVVERSDFWLPIGYPEDLKKAEEALKGEK